MKYLVLAGDNYYPAGGNDVVFSSNDMQSAVTQAMLSLVEPINGTDRFSRKADWAEVVDTDTLGLVWSSSDDN